MELTDRQTELADAALRVLSRQGLSKVTFRAVAQESGWSLGAVQKAFPTKGELLAAMMHRTRVTAVPAAFQNPGRPTLHAWLTELLVSLQPLDPPRRSIMLRAIAFDTIAHHDPRVAKAIATSDAMLREQLSALVRKAQQRGEVSDELDVEVVVRVVLALAEGMASQLLYDPISQDDARHHASYAVARLLGDPL